MRLFVSRKRRIAAAVLLVLGAAAAARVSFLVGEADSLVELEEAIRFDDFEDAETMLSASFPIRLARRVLGTEDDFAFREAILWYVKRSETNVVEALRNRSRAREAFAAIAETDADPARRSDAENLLGILSIEDALLFPGNAERFLSEAAVHFREAVRTNPENEVAKYNLELLLRMVRSQQNVQPGADTDDDNGGVGTEPPGGGW